MKYLFQDSGRKVKLKGLARKIEGFILPHEGFKDLFFSILFYGV